MRSPQLTGDCERKVKLVQFCTFYVDTWRIRLTDLRWSRFQSFNLLSVMLHHWCNTYFRTLIIGNSSTSDFKFRKSLRMFWKQVTSLRLINSLHRISRYNFWWNKISCNYLGFKKYDATVIWHNLWRLETTFLQFEGRYKPSLRLWGSDKSIQVIFDTSLGSSFSLKVLICVKYYNNRLVQDIFR